MMMAKIFLVLLSLAASPIGAEGEEARRAAVTPVQKVIELLQGMVEKGKNCSVGP